MIDQNILRMMSLSLMLPLSLFTIANCWNVDKEPIIEPPIHDE
jgi:hypothetical protein